MHIDSVDRNILSLVQRDAALPVSQLAERVALSKTACWRRLKRLEAAGVIKQRVTLLDAKALNLGLTVYVSVRTAEHSQQWQRMFSQVVANIPEILEVNRMSGDPDYLLKAVVADMAGYDRLYKKLMAADILDISSSFVMEEVKMTTALPLGYSA
jgi:Lrp/AsnC family transcriptional regulator